MAELDDLCEQIVRDGVAPHAAAGWAARRDGGRWEVSLGGATRSFFDLASLTKPMTALAVSRSDYARDATLAELWEEARGTPCEHATLELLLAHRAGLEAHVPLYRALVDGRPFDRRAAVIEALHARRADAHGAIPAEGFPPVYSDLGYILVGEALDHLVGSDDFGDEIWRSVVEPMALGDHLGSARALVVACSTGPVSVDPAPGASFHDRVLPTEIVAWRGGEIRGRVHDENAFALGGAGACGHAGMFGTVEGVVRFGARVLDAIEGRDDRLGSDHAWLVAPRPGGTLRAGFDGKSGTGSSAGDRAGPRTFGHLGFTGTSLWIDPDAEAVVVLLTNRVHPTRDNVAIRAARPRAHDALFAMAAGR